MMVRRYMAEFVGTFTIVLAPVLLASSGRMAGGDGSLLAAALVSGLPVLAMIYALGPISAAHFNPAVTLAFAVAKRFPWKYVLPYWVSQLLGSLAAAGVGFALFGAAAGAHIPADPTRIGLNLGLEIVLSFFLMLAIIAVASDKRVSGTVPALAIGFTVVFCVLIGGPITGGSMNPARSFGPAVFVGTNALGNLWLYALGPMIGACLGAVIFEALRIEPDQAKNAPELT